MLKSVGLMLSLGLFFWCSWRVLFARPAQPLRVPVDDQPWRDLAEPKASIARHALAQEYDRLFAEKGWGDSGTRLGASFNARADGTQKREGRRGNSASGKSTPSITGVGETGTGETPLVIRRLPSKSTESGDGSRGHVIGLCPDCWHFHSGDEKHGSCRWERCPDRQGDAG